MHASQATHTTYGNGEPEILAHPSPLPHPCCRKGKIEILAAFLTKQRIGQKLQVRCQCKVTADIMPTCDEAELGGKEQFQRFHHGSKQNLDSASGAHKCRSALRSRVKLSDNAPKDTPGGTIRLPSTGFNKPTSKTPLGS